VQWFYTIDPLAEKYPWQSPYCYAANNPVKYIDKDGKGPELALLYFVPGVGEALLAATAIVAVSYVVYKGAEATYSAVTDARAGYKEQQRRESKSRQEDANTSRSHQESVDNNIGKPNERGGTTPKGGGSTVAKVVTATMLGANLAKRIIEQNNAAKGSETTNNSQNSQSSTNNNSTDNTKNQSNTNESSNTQSTETKTTQPDYLKPYVMPIDQARPRQ